MKLHWVGVDMQQNYSAKNGSGQMGHPYQCCQNGKTVLNKTCLKFVNIYKYLAYICQSVLTWAEYVGLLQFSD